MSSHPRTFVDTNILVYAFDDADPRKQAVAQSILDVGRSGHLVLSPQVLQEFYVTVTRKLARPLDEAAALNMVQHLAALPLVFADGALVVSALRLHQRYQISVWDALILQAAITGGCTRVLSEDLQHGMRVGNLVVEDPFRP